MTPCPVPSRWNPFFSADQQQQSAPSVITRDQNYMIYCCTSEPLRCDTAGTKSVANFHQLADCLCFHETRVPSVSDSPIRGGALP